MKGYKCLWLIIVFLFLSTLASSQENASVSTAKWDHEFSTCFYFIPGNFIFMPIYKTDTAQLHLEFRYNYEDINSFSAWIGYNFKGGNKFTFTITPMFGGMVGNTSGLLSGLEVTLDYAGFEFYSESEYFFDLEEKSNNFYYNWTDLTYSPRDWLWIGLSAQRTRLYKTDLEIQRGFFFGLGYKWFEIETYLYNLYIADPYVILVLSVNL